MFGGCMAVRNQNQTRSDPGDRAQAGSNPPEAADVLAKTSYEGHQHDDGEHRDHEHGFELAEVLRVVFGAVAAIAVWFHLWEPFSRVSIIGLAATLIGGYPIFKEAFENIVERRMTMELSVTLAPVSRLAIGGF